MLTAGIFNFSLSVIYYQLVELKGSCCSTYRLFYYEKRQVDINCFKFNSQNFCGSCFYNITAEFFITTDGGGETTASTAKFFLTTAGQLRQLFFKNNCLVLHYDRGGGVEQLLQLPRYSYKQQPSAQAVVFTTAECSGSCFYNCQIHLAVVFSTAEYPGSCFVPGQLFSQLLSN